MQSPSSRFRIAPQNACSAHPGMTGMLTLGQAWAVLGLAIVLEVAGTTSMRLSEGFSRLTPSILIFVFYAASFALNTLVIRTLGLSVVYAVWSGVGTVLTALIGFLYFKEPATTLKMVSIGLIVIGVFGLHAASRGSA
jgi:small multidrug resistance pump